MIPDFELMHDGLDEMRAICVDLGYDLNDVAYNSVQVRNNIVTLETYVRDEDGKILVNDARTDALRTVHRHPLPSPPQVSRTLK